MTHIIQKMLAKVKEQKGDIRANSKLGELFRRHGIRDTPELKRIRQLPKREWRDLLLNDYKDYLSAHLRRPGSSALLFDAQTAALTEYYDYGGFLGNIGLGEGKCVVGSTTLYDPELGRVQVKETAFARVLASDEMGRFHVALANIVPSGVKACVKLHLRDGTKVELSTDHPVRTQKGWVQAGDITPAHVVAVARKYAQPTREHRVAWRAITEITSDAVPRSVPAMWWCAPDGDVRFFLHQLFTMHGTFSERSVTLKTNDPDVIRDVRFFCARLGILTHVRQPDSERSFIEIRHESLKDFLQISGGFASPKAKLLLENSERLEKNATDIVPIALPEMREMSVEDKWPRGVLTRMKALHNIRTTYLSRQVFQEICSQLDYRGSREWLKDSDYAWEWVREVEQTGEQEVFDLSVPDYHNFVGDGVVLHNTLITALAPTLLGAERPVLLAPGSLREKTANDFVRYREDWLVHPRIEFVSYEQLSRNPELLIAINPDILMADEVHCLKNLKAGCTKRVKRYMSLRPRTKFMGLSGTVSTRSLREFWHLMMWALGPENMPLPRNYDELDEWAKAVDEKVEGHERVSPGVLLEHLGGKDLRVPEGTPDHEIPVVQARMAVRQRLETTAGYMMTTKISCDASMSLTVVRPPASATLDAAISELRASLQDLNGDEMIRPADVWAKARMMSCGFFYRWTPEPPNSWREARRNWFRFVRYALSHYSIRIDTPMQLAQEVDRGSVTEPFDIAFDPRAPILDGKPHVPDWRTPQELLATWRAEQPHYKYTLVPEWLDLSRVQWIANRTLKDDTKPQIVWVEHVAVGQKLSELTGRPFHHSKGLDARGVHIEKARGPIIASVEANYKGHNLQQFDRNFIVSCMPSGMMWEQLFGRTHRRGQLSDHVAYEVLEACEEHKEGLAQVLRDAAFAFQTQNQPQRLLLADKINV